MSTAALWTRLRRKIGPTAAPQQTITVQTIGVPNQDLDAMQSIFDVLGQQLSVTLELKRDAGEMVLLQLESGTRVTARQIHALTGGRPAVFITTPSPAVAQLASSAERFAVHQRVLLPQLTELPLVRRRSAMRNPPSALPRDSRWDSAPSTGAGAFSPSGNSLPAETTPSATPNVPEEVDADQLEVLRTVLRGLRDPKTPALAASYGPSAQLRFDFKARIALIDPLALQHLRVRRELPRPAGEPRLQPDAAARELDEMAWHLGLASGHLPLLGEPADWSETALVVLPGASIERYTKMPRHLEMARRLRDAALTPAELRRAAHISVNDLRNFLQACLFLNLVQWASALEATTPPRA